MGKKLLFILSACALLVVGCTPALQYSEVSPRFAEFHPKSVVILPFINSVGMESANEQTATKFINALQQAKLFDSIIDPQQVKTSMMNNQGTLNVISRYRTTWTATSMCDPKLSQWISKAFNADSILFGEVTAWSEETTPYHHFYNAGVAFRWVDASGEVLWKAAETWQIIAGNPCIFDCSHPDKAMDQTVSVVMMNWPVAGKK
jgi:hypothetical protein